jgi:hypothetical protein
MMEKSNLETERTQKIKQDILTAWQEGHGGSAEQVHLYQGEEGLVLLIPKALYQAELELNRTSTGGGRVLNQYLRTLLHTVASDFIPMMEEIAGKSIREVVPLIDLRAGWAIALYRF